MTIEWKEIEWECEDFQLPLLTMRVDETFEICEVSFGLGSYGQYAVVSTEKGKYRTSSSVLLSQLHAAQQALTEDRIKVTLKKKNNYYIFE